MLLWVLFACCFILQCFATPLFLKLIWPNRSMKSLAAKMLAATLFVCVGFLSVNIANNKSDFAITMVVGLLLGWVGDFFLHSEKNVFFGIGFASFWALGTFEGYNNLNAVEVAAFAVLMLVSVFVFKRFKLEFSIKLLKYAVWVYTAVLSFMFIKATSLGVHFLLNGGQNGVLALLTLAFGSLFFLLSDATIGILMFGGQRKNRPLKIFNIVTYFAGQMLLASSILFVNV